METASQFPQENNRSSRYYYTGAFLLSFSIVLLTLMFTFELLYGRAPNVYAICFCVTTLFTFTWVFVFTRRMIKQGQGAQVEYYTIGVLRLVTSTVMMGYAFTKLSNGHMYQSYYALDTKLGELSDFDTVWSFYGRYSSMQALLGVMEFVPSLLLLFRRTACLGALFMLPVAGNVVLLNIYYRIGGLTLPISMLVMVFTIYILYAYKESILLFIRSVREKSPAPITLTPGRKKILSILKFLPFTFILILAVLRLVFHQNARVLKGGFELAEIRINGHTLHKDSLPPDVYRKIYFEKRQLQSGVINAQGFSRVAVNFMPSDSIIIAYSKGAMDSYSIPEVAGRFYGFYKTGPNDEIILTGTQEQQQIEARYKKLPLREFNYWWE